MTSDDDRRGMPEFLPLSRPDGLHRHFRYSPPHKTTTLSRVLVDGTGEHSQPDAQSF